MPIDPEGAVQVLSLVYGLTERIASETPKMAYNEVAQPIPASRGGGRGYGPYFGSVPDFRDDIKGVLFSDVQNNSPAAKAGLKAGDKVVKIAGHEVKNVYDYTYALDAVKIGKPVSVVVLRNGALERS